MSLALRRSAIIIIIRMSFSASKYFTIDMTLLWFSRVCVCVPVRSFLPPRSSRPRNIGTYVFTATRKTRLYIIIVIFAENASFRSYGFICLPRMPLTTSEPQNTDTNGFHAMSASDCMTLLFTILTKNASFGSYSTFVYLLRAHILNINMLTFIVLPDMN